MAERLFPGSRWWAFDFHTHTPASTDTYWYKNGVALAPEDWLRKYMAAEIDCVAVTDHNSGAWIDRLKEAYDSMKSLADAGTPPEGFRPLAVFPGVEISANGGVHVLAIFDSSATTSDIDSLLGSVGYVGTKGDSDGETTKSAAEVVAAILRAGAIPVPAHADHAKGLLRVNSGTRECALSAAMVKQVLDVEGLLAVEWCDPINPYPEAVASCAKSLAKVLGSDCHSFQGHQAPGSRFTWVKMAIPTLKGLRLALLDGNHVSIRRSDEGPFDPIKTPAHWIRSVEIEKARVMGRRDPVRLELSPYFNAIVGGRGTGKSTIVHALRLAARREAEIQILPKDSEPRERFEAFRAISRSRDPRGALLPETRVRVVWQSDGRQLRINWAPSESATPDVEEWCEGQWQPSASQSINASRFPLRIFSQGQIAAMAGNGRQALLAIIDEAAGVEPLRLAFEEARRTFFAQRARLRELDGRLATLPEVERRRFEVDTKLGALTQGDHSAVQQAFSRALHQVRVVEDLYAQLREGVAAVRNTSERLLLDDWLLQHFDGADADLLAWRSDADALLERIRQQLQEQASLLEQGIETLDADARLAAWRTRAQSARLAHEQLQTRLAEQGVADPQAFARLTRERQQLEAEIKGLLQLQVDRTILMQQIDAQQSLLRRRREEITQRRQAFLQEKLARNPHVRISVVPFGFDPETIERSLRELIDATDDRFADDILNMEHGRGLAYDLSTANEATKLDAVEAARKQIIERPVTLGGWFRNYLEKRAEKPEFADHVSIWFPEDDLKIEYQRDERWYAISEGSQGQRSAALLAFLLAFGDEPIVLDQPEDDLDNHLIYDLIVRQIRENKLRRQLIIVTHNPNVVVNGDAELVHVMAFGGGQCYAKEMGALQEASLRKEVCRVMEGGPVAFARRWKRLGKEV